MGFLKEMTWNESSVSAITALRYDFEGMEKILRTNDSIIQEIFKTTSENTQKLEDLTERCSCNRERIEQLTEYLEAETARVSRRYDETMNAVDVYFEDVNNTLDTMQELNDAHFEDIDNEITEARKMQLRTHVVCAIAMVSSIVSIILTVVFA